MDYLSYASNTLMLMENVNIEPCNLPKIFQNFNSGIDFIDFCQEVQGVFCKEPDLYMETMKELNQGNGANEQICSPIGSDMEFSSKMISELPSQVKSKLIQKYQL